MLYKEMQTIMKDLKSIPRVIAIEGVDGAGKATQAKLLDEALFKLGYNTELISFPNYAETSSTLVKEYLNGSYGILNKLPVNIVASLYGIDRALTLQTKEIQKKLDSGKIIIFDRYVNSNIYHQVAKTVSSKSNIAEITYKERKMIDELLDFEYTFLGNVFPELSIYLDIPVEHAINQIRERNSVHGSVIQNDIHEKSTEYLEKCVQVANKYSGYLGMERISCGMVDEETNTFIVYSKEKIHNAILDLVLNY